MNTRLAISLLIAGALAFACGPRSHSEAPAALASALPVNANPAPAPEKITRRSSTRSATKIEPSFDVAVTQRVVRFTFDITNASTKHLELDFANGQAYDFVVVDSLGREVWRWSKGRLFTQGVQNKQLSAGGAMQARETWKRAVPGHYTAIATLRSANFPIQQHADFVVH
jgi:hypothetical protein